MRKGKNGRKRRRKLWKLRFERRKAADLEHLLHPSKKTSAQKSSSSSSSSSQIRRKVASDDNDDDGPKSEPLTREELRERKLQAELRRTFTNKRSSITAGYQKHGRRLPGGAVDVTTNGLPASTSSGTQSVKARLAAMPNTLTKLNTVKRDTRTIDEILQDRAKSKEMKTLDGDEALAFDDWFGTKKKDTRSGSAAPASGSNTPKSSTVSGSRQRKYATSKPLTSKPKASAASSSSSRPSSSLPPKKRGRSSSRSESPYSSKRRAIDSEELDDEALDVSGLIWGIMGKKRSDYMKMDVFSDDEDMEADASALEREEKRSALIARKEEQVALEEERRHEEEKRRRKMRAEH
ncbi:hypothetical protein BT96DRAFT_956254 [Gymnopus androsaceus JB14]|uniref:SPT2-domain-containing protein n=1 Tax=Gymnopus androsaceus JB14 TaxID=1447944 RepID=A0A6A4HWY8_9AGAR|nr:hypothetical protein BT96DRAFT_956254 [Gymnopus androsaceus JB14]